jgi:hypothetical protein
LKPEIIELVKEKVIKLEERGVSSNTKPEKEEIDENITTQDKFKTYSSEELVLLKKARSCAVSMEDAYEHICGLKKAKTDLSADHQYKEYIYVLRYNLFRLCETLTQFKHSEKANKISSCVIDIQAATDIRDSIRHDLSLLNKETMLLKLASVLIPLTKSERLTARLNSLNANAPINLEVGNYGFSIRNREVKPLSDEALINNIRTEFKNIEQFYQSYIKQGIANSNAAEAIKMSICTIGSCLKAMSPTYSTIKSLNCFDKFRRLGNKVAHELSEEGLNTEDFIYFYDEVSNKTIEEIGSSIQQRAAFFEQKIKDIAKIQGPHSAKILQDREQERQLETNNNNNISSNNDYKSPTQGRC